MMRTPRELDPYLLTYLLVLLVEALEASCAQPRPVRAKAVPQRRERVLDVRDEAGATHAVAPAVLRPEVVGRV